MEEITLDMFFTAYKRILTIPIYHVFMFTVLADVLTGSGKALKLGQFDSRNGTEGLKKHLVVLFLVLGICPYLKMMGFENFSFAILTFYIAVYAVSILENLEQLGIPFPDFLSDYFNRLGDQARAGKVEKDDK